MTVCAVVFDVGETLVDEERARRIQALAAAGVVAVHVRRGPWGPLQDARAPGRSSSRASAGSSIV